MRRRPRNSTHERFSTRRLAGTPSVLFDEVAVIFSGEGAKALSTESAAIDFARGTYGDFKAIAIDKGGRALLNPAGVGKDAGVVDAKDKDAFIAAAKTRQWDREDSVRTFAQPKVEFPLGLGRSHEATCVP
jgi:catalase